jgi:hypothetical protein
VKSLALGVANKMETVGVGTVVKPVSSEVRTAQNPRAEESRPLCVLYELILLTIHDTSTFLYPQGLARAQAFLLRFAMLPVLPA